MATRNLVSTEWQAPRHTDPLSLLQLPQRLPPRRGPQLRYQGSTCKQFLAFIRPSSLRCSSKVCCRRNFTSQEVQTVQCERRFGGRPATTSKATSGPSSLQRPVPPAKPQGFRKPKVFGPLTLRHKEAGGARRHRRLPKHTAPHSGAPGLLGTSRPLAYQTPGLQSQWTKFLSCDEKPRAVQASGLQCQRAIFNGLQISRRRSTSQSPSLARTWPGLTQGGVPQGRSSLRVSAGTQTIGIPRCSSGPPPAAPAGNYTRIQPLEEETSPRRHLGGAGRVGWTVGRF